MWCVWAMHAVGQDFPYVACHCVCKPQTLHFLNPYVPYALKPYTLNPKPDSSIF